CASIHKRSRSSATTKRIVFCVTAAEDIGRRLWSPRTCEGEPHEGSWDMANSMTGDLHKATRWSIGLSVLMIAAGVLAICVPVIAGVAVTALVGWLLVFSGLLHLAFAWRAGRAGAVLWEVALGIVYGAIGIYLLASPVAGLASLTLAIAA